MWDIGLILAAYVAIQPAQPSGPPQSQPQSQPQTATLEGCEFVEERWVCRYRLPDIQLVDGGPPATPLTVPVQPAAPSGAPPRSRSTREPPSNLDKVLRSSMARTVVGVVARGLMGALLGTRTRRR